MVLDSQTQTISLIYQDQRGTQTFLARNSGIGRMKQGQGLCGATLKPARHATLPLPLSERVGVRGHAARCVGMASAQPPQPTLAQPRVSFMAPPQDPNDLEDKVLSFRPAKPSTSGAEAPRDDPAGCRDDPLAGRARFDRFGVVDSSNDRGSPGRHDDPDIIPGAVLS